MRVILFLAIHFFLFSNASFSMEEKHTQSSTENSIIYLNIGGERLVTTKRTLGLSGMSFFKNLLEGKFALVYDRDGNIFIDYNKDAAPILSEFFTTLELPEPCNLRLARQVAEYFGSDQMAELILQKENSKNCKPQWKCKNFTLTENDQHCPINFSILEGNLSINNTITHLLNAHAAKIIEIIKTEPNSLTIRLKYKFDNCRACTQKFSTASVTVDHALLKTSLENYANEAENLAKKGN